MVVEVSCGSIAAYDVLCSSTCLTISAAASKQTISVTKPAFKSLRDSPVCLPFHLSDPACTKQNSCKAQQTHSCSAFSPRVTHVLRHHTPLYLTAAFIAPAARTKPRASPTLPLHLAYCSAHHSPACETRRLWAVRLLDLGGVAA